MATIKEIASAANCSPSTVSIVLGGKAEDRNISETTRKRVLAVASEMGYQPNIAARSLRCGGTDELQIAMFWAQDFRAGMMVRFWDGLSKSLQDEKRRIRLVIIPYINGHLKDAKALTSTSEFHAAIICNASEEDLLFLKETKPAVPVVLYNRICKGYCSVNVDDALMGTMAAKALFSQGCKSAVVLSGEAVFEGMNTRIQGFTLEGQRNGLHCTKIYYCNNSIRGGYTAVQELLLAEWNEKLPDGVFCGSSMVAHGAVRALAEAGIYGKNLPKIVAIGNGMEDQDKFSIPSISVIHMPMEEMAQECLKLLLLLIDGKASTDTHILLDTEYIARESCGQL